MYYNTNKESGETLAKSEEKTRTQEEIIFDLFNFFYNRTFTADEVHDMINASHPITSTRRAITNLSKEGKVIKTAVMRQGSYGKMTHAYKFNIQ